jgi:DNA-binding CsgD family transcriptional regulator
MDVKSLQEKFRNLFQNQTIHSEDIDYSILNFHIRLLEQIAYVENSSVALYDMFSGKYVFVRNRFRDILNYDEQAAADKGYSYFFSFMHPDDIPFTLDTCIRSMEFLQNVNPDERKDYKTVFEFRLKGSNSKYIRFIQQLVALELDRKGNIWLVLIIVDANPNQNNDKAPLRSLINIKNGTTGFLADHDEEKSNQLTRREIEILGLLSKGMASKEIADQLFLSVNTVNNHRQNIIRKMDVNNTSEALAYASKIGIV